MLRWPMVPSRSGAIVAVVRALGVGRLSAEVYKEACSPGAPRRTSLSVGQYACIQAIQLLPYVPGHVNISCPSTAPRQRPTLSDVQQPTLSVIDRGGDPLTLSLDLAMRNPLLLIQNTPSPPSALKALDIPLVV
ncbi:hypothetical protein BC629DRAFT_1540584, partial [Irpex lacteus]